MTNFVNYKIVDRFSQLYFGNHEENQPTDRSRHLALSGLHSVSSEGHYCRLDAGSGPDNQAHPLANTAVSGDEVAYGF